MKQNPLKGKICHGLMCAGIGGPDGTHPICMMGRCSEYSVCLSNSLVSRKQIRDLTRPRRWWEVWRR